MNHKFKRVTKEKDFHPALIAVGDSVIIEDGMSKRIIQDKINTAKEFLGMDFTWNRWIGDISSTLVTRLK